MSNDESTQSTTESTTVSDTTTKTTDEPTSEREGVSDEDDKGGLEPPEDVGPLESPNQPEVKTELTSGGQPAGDPAALPDPTLAPSNAPDTTTQAPSTVPSEAPAQPPSELDISSLVLGDLLGTPNDSNRVAEPVPAGNRDGAESLAMFAYRTGRPVNAIRDANPDVVDEKGDLDPEASNLNVPVGDVLV